MNLSVRMARWPANRILHLPEGLKCMSRIQVKMSPMNPRIQYRQTMLKLLSLTIRWRQFLVNWMNREYVFWTQHVQLVCTLEDGGTASSELECQQTSTTKTFHFADGSSAPAIVWRIPILLAGHRGEVLSAEVETGSTPLLLSVTSMESLQMDLFLKERRAHIGALGVDVEILMTRTKHRAIDLTRSDGLDLRTWPRSHLQLCQR